MLRGLRTPDPGGRRIPRACGPLPPTPGHNPQKNLAERNSGRKPVAKGSTRTFTNDTNRTPQTTPHARLEKGSQPNFSFATNKFAGSFSTVWSPRIILPLRTRSNSQLQDRVHVRFQPKRSASCRIGSSQGRFRSNMGSKRRPGSRPELPKSLRESSESLPETNLECRVALETSQPQDSLFYYHKSTEKRLSLIHI